MNLYLSIYYTIQMHNVKYIETVKTTLACCGNKPSSGHTHTKPSSGRTHTKPSSGHIHTKPSLGHTHSKVRTSCRWWNNIYMYSLGMIYSILTKTCQSSLFYLHAFDIVQTVCVSNRNARNGQLYCQCQNLHFANINIYIVTLTLVEELVTVLYCIVLELVILCAVTQYSTIITTSSFCQLHLKLDTTYTVTKCTKISKAWNVCKLKQSGTHCVATASYDHW
jgi:hypothetical protein